ncbi:MAG: hypothetical protein JSW55_07130 [Chloroflexota bacterium]|nr:MAG: hypothetical protein JSW55_07130 [Chloroflexota bacterium]
MIALNRSRISFFVVMATLGFLLLALLPHSPSAAQPMDKNGKTSNVLASGATTGEADRIPEYVANELSANVGWTTMWPRSAPAPIPEEHCGDIDQEDETWAGNGVVHVLTCHVRVTSGFSLTI